MESIRFGHLIQPGEKGDILLLGFPHDQGVEINGGRVGAAQGPEQFRLWLKRFGVACNPEMDIDLTALALADAGDIPQSCSHEEAHEALKHKTEALLRAGGIPFVVGGGNDQSYPNAFALLNVIGDESLGVVNVDAHLDVRPLKDDRPHSGSPFRLLLDDPRFQGKNFVEFASQGSQCDREHAEFVRTRGGSILWLDALQSEGQTITAFRKTLGKLAWRCSAIFVSFDLDSIAGAEAPGVSCPGTLGLTAQEAFAIAFRAGCHPAVRLFDLSEYNPVIESERTGLLAVGIFYYFCLGVASRKEGT